MARTDDALGPSILLHVDRDAAENIERLGEQYVAVAVLKLADYDRMARALALLATVDVAALQAMSASGKRAYIPAHWPQQLDIAIAAIEATRATRATQEEGR